MPPPAKPLHIAAGLPIDQASRAEHVALGQANLSNENVRLVERGALDKRFGFTSLPLARLGLFGGTLTSRSAGRRLFDHDGGVMVIDGSTLDSYIQAAQASVSRDRVPECAYSLQGVGAPGAGAVLFDTATCNGYVALSHSIATSFPTASGQVLYEIVSASTGELVSELVSSVTDGRSLLASFGDRYFVRFEYDAGTTEITWSIFDTQNVASGWTSTASVVAATATISFAVCTLSDRAAIAYGTASGTDRVTVKTYNQTGLLETRTIATSSVTPTVVAMNGSVADTLWVGWSQGGVMRAIGLDADALAVTRATVATIISIGVANFVDLDICEGSAAGTARAWATTDAAPVQLFTRDIATVAGAATTPGATNSVRNVCPSSRSFQIDGRYYMACVPMPDGSVLGVSTSNPQALCSIVDWTENQSYVRPVANIEPGLICAVASTGKFSRISDGHYAYGIQVTASGSFGIRGLISQASTLSTLLLELDFRALDRWVPAEHAGNTFLGGALLAVYDGARLTEAGFLARPSQPTSSVGGTGITGTNYRVVAVYEDIDASGNWVVSGVSDPSAPQSAANQTITWSTQTLGVTYRAANINTMRVAWYRTLTGGEPPYFRVGVSANVPGTATSTFADSTSDAVLATRSLLYGTGNLPGTNGSGQNRLAPAGLMRLLSYEGMLVGARGSTVFYSGQTVQGEATWFSPVFNVAINDDVEALDKQDGTLFVWTRNAIFAIAGQAPSDNGLQGGLGAPRRIASDVGAAQWPTCSTSLGIFFVSARGIEILTRAQTVDYVGEAIQDTFAEFPIVTAMTFDPESSCVLVELADAVTAGAVSDGGRTLVYDTRAKGWYSIDRRKSGTGTQDTPAQDGRLVWTGSAWRYAWLGAEGRVYVEDHTTWLDADGSYVTSLWEPAEIKMGLQQDQRIYQALMLLERRSEAGLQMELAHDRKAYNADEPAKTWDQSTTAGRVQLPAAPKPHDTSLRVRIKDTAPLVLGDGRGFSFVGLTLDIAPKQGPTRGTTRLPASTRR